MFKFKLKEDTVSADRKENIIFDPDAWRKNKSGKKTAAVTSRQNFDNEKFTRRGDKDDEVNESAYQNTGSSNIDIQATPSPVSKTTDKEKEEKAAKSGQSSSQIQFVTGKEQVVDSSKTLGMPAPGGQRKIGEAVLAKALQRVKVDKNVGTETLPPFDGPYTKHKDEKNSDGTPTSPISKVRQLAKAAMNKQKSKINETALNDKDPHGDYQAKRKALQDIQLDPNTSKDKELSSELVHRKAALEKEYDKYRKEEVELNELSTDLLARYKKAATVDHKAASEQGDIKRGDKRFSGTLKATRKQFDNDLKKESVEGDSNRQINYYQFLKRLKAAGIKVPAAIQVESVSDDELDASDSKRRATKAVKETPKHERDEVANSMQPAKPDAAKIALRKRIEAHHERMRQKAEEGDDPYALK